MRQNVKKIVANIPDEFPPEISQAETAVTNALRNEERRMYDMALEFSLYTQRWTYRAIAKEITERAARDGFSYTVGHTQVFKDIQQVLAEYQKRFDMKAEEFITRELSNIEELEREAWACFQASKTGEKVSETEGVVGAGGSTKMQPGDKIRRRAKSSHGEVRYLTELRKLAEMRIRLLGFTNGYKKQSPESEPEPLTPATEIRRPGYSIKSLSPVELKEFAEKLQRQRAAELNPQNVLKDE